MAKWSKRILLTLVVLVALLLAAAILVPILFSDKIEAAVKEQVNANLNATVEWGDWDIGILRSFPNASVEVKNVRVCNKAPFEGICLADIGDVQVTIGLMSLFSDRIQVQRVALDRPDIHVKVLKDGRANWDIAKSDSTSAELPADTSATRFNVALKQYSISKGHIIYDDESLPMVMELNGVEHTGSGDFTQDLFTLRTKTTADSLSIAYDGVKYLRNVKAQATADIDMDIPHMKFTFKDNDIKVNRLELGLDGWLAMPTDDIDMDLRWNMKKNDIGALLSLVPAAFASNLDGVDMTGKAAFSGYVKGTYNETTMPGFGVTITVDNGRFKYPSLPASVEAIFVDCDIRSPQGKDLDGMVVDLKRFALNMAGNPVEARMHLETPISDPNVDAAVKANLDLASVQKVVPLPKGNELSGKVKADVQMAGRMSDVEAQRYDKFKAQGQLALSGMNYRSDSLPYAVGISNLVFDFSPRFLALTDFTGEVGRSDIKASGRLDNYLQWWLKDSTLTGNFNLASNRFDLNELMGAPAASTAPAKGAPKADTAAMGVIEVPKNVDFTMAAAVKEVLYDDMKLADAKGSLRVHDRQVDLRGMGFNMFDGRIGMDGTYSTVDKEKPAFNMDLNVGNVDIAQLVAKMDMVGKMAPIAKSCTGRLNTTLALKGVLDQAMAPVMNSLAGQGTLQTKNVALKDFKPLVEMSNVLKMPQLAMAKIQDVDFSYEIQDGKMITKPFNVKIDRLSANVAGSTAFADQAIDYTVKTKVPTDMFGAEAGQLVSGLLGQMNRSLGTEAKLPAELDLTAKITGTVEKPVVKPVFAGGGSNLKETVKEEVKQQLNEQIDKVKADAIAKARAEADRLVAEARKQADDIKAKARSEAANAKAQAYKAADDLVNQAANPFAKAAAKLAADKAKQAADAQENKFIAEADKRADGLVATAQSQGDALVKKAESTNTTVK
ncbi:MAG: AsmA family protein [Bacteroidetes bacterium]|nr:AsmA family protein [Bacteroidota bacterium]MBS1939539.1 AsmA family protein [Bacteroidota bacterium]